MCGKVTHVVIKLNTMSVLSPTIKVKQVARTKLVASAVLNCQHALGPSAIMAQEAPTRPAIFKPLLYAYRKYNLLPA